MPLPWQQKLRVILTNKINQKGAIESTTTVQRFIFFSFKFQNYFLQNILFCQGQIDGKDSPTTTER